MDKESFDAVRLALGHTIVIHACWACKDLPYFGEGAALLMAALTCSMIHVTIQWYEELPWHLKKRMPLPHSWSKL